MDKDNNYEPEDIVECQLCIDQLFYIDSYECSFCKEYDILCKKCTHDCVVDFGYAVCMKCFNKKSDYFLGIHDYFMND